MRRTGIVTGMAAEAECVRRAVTKGGWDNAPLLFCAGASTERARAGAMELVERGAQALVSFGIAGGLDPVHRTGTLIVAEYVATRAGTVWATNEVWRHALIETASHAGLAPVGGTVATVSRASASAASKKQLRKETGACAVDMESAGVAAAAAAAGLPFLALRAIADPADRSLPHCVNAALSAEGRPRIGAILLALLIRPWECVALSRLARDNAVAMRTLRRVAALDAAFLPPL